MAPRFTALVLPPIRSLLVVLQIYLLHRLTMLPGRQRRSMLLTSVWNRQSEESDRKKLLLDLVTCWFRMSIASQCLNHTLLLHGIIGYNKREKMQRLWPDDVKRFEDGSIVLLQCLDLELHWFRSHRIYCTTFENGLL